MTKGPKALDRYDPDTFRGDLFSEIQLSEQLESKARTSIVPGLVLVGITALAAQWLSEHYGTPPILMGLLLGLGLSAATRDARLSSGLDFASKTLLRVGIVFIGFRVTLGNISALGWAPFLALMGTMLAVITLTTASAKMFRQSTMFGLVAGCATAICGISAALAVWGLVGKRRLDQSQFTIIILGITLASALGMTLYPLIANHFTLSDAQTGFLLGASIHDVAQSIGAGFSVSEAAGETATVVKLTRVSLLAPVLILTALGLGRLESKEAGRAVAIPSLRQAIPWFIAAFIGVVCLNTLVTLPPAAATVGTTLSKICLMMAVVAAAIKSDLSELLSHGWRCFGPIALASLLALTAALFAAQLI